MCVVCSVHIAFAHSQLIHSHDYGIQLSQWFLRRDLYFVEYCHDLRVRARVQGSHDFFFLFFLFFTFLFVCFWGFGIFWVVLLFWGVLFSSFACFFFFFDFDLFLFLVLNIYLLIFSAIVIMIIVIMHTRSSYHTVLSPIEGAGGMRIYKI